MNGHETDFYKRDVPQIRETLKKIGESLETIAHSLEVLTEIRIEDIARNHTELSDEDDKDLFKDEESYIPFPDVDDIQTVEDDINIPPYEDRPNPEWGELPDEEEYDEDLDDEIRMHDANNN